MCPLIAACGKWFWVANGWRPRGVVLRYFVVIIQMDSVTQNIQLESILL